jgi:hypothetical protein
VNEDSMALWKVLVEVNDIDDGLVWAEDVGVRVVGGMNDVTTAMGYAVSRRSARMFWKTNALQL